MLQIVIPGKPVPLNNAYSNGFRGKRFMVKRAVDFKKMVASIVRGKKFNFDERKHFISIEIYFYTAKLISKKGSVSKISGDIDGKIKLIVDAIFGELGINDAFICHANVKKLPGNEDKTVLILRSELLSSLDSIEI